MREGDRGAVAAAGPSLPSLLQDPGGEDRGLRLWPAATASCPCAVLHCT